MHRPVDARAAVTTPTGPELCKWTHRLALPLEKNSVHHGCRCQPSICGLARCVHVGVRNTRPVAKGALSAITEVSAANNAWAWRDMVAGFGICAISGRRIARGLAATGTVASRNARLLAVCGVVITHKVHHRSNRPVRHGQGFGWAQHHVPIDMSPSQ